MVNENKDSNKIPDFVTAEELEDSIEEFDDADLAEESDLSYDEGVEAGLEINDLTKIDDDSVIIRREDTRSRLAIIYTIATFFVFVLGMFIAVLDGILREVSIVDNLTEIVPLISGVFLGSLGFVLGYYFRKGEE